MTCFLVFCVTEYGKAVLRSALLLLNLNRCLEATQEKETLTLRIRRSIRNKITIDNVISALDKNYAFFDASYGLRVEMYGF